MSKPKALCLKYLARLVARTPSYRAMEAKSLKQSNALRAISAVALDSEVTISHLTARIIHLEAELRKRK